ncbi:MAG TPA: NUDIX domain-containing protein [Anaerolineaceae bacterium]
MKQLIRVDRDIPWLPAPGEGRLYITDQLPPDDVCQTAFGFGFDGSRVLLTHLKKRDWDIPGGAIDPGETPGEAAVREVWEETSARVEIVDLIGIQELELLGPKPEKYHWGYPLSVQVYFRVKILELLPFEENFESLERGFFAPEDARKLPTMINHGGIYEEALRRALQK